MSGDGTFDPDVFDSGVFDVVSGARVIAIPRILPTVSVSRTVYSTIPVSRTVYSTIPVSRTVYSTIPVS